MSYTKGPWAAFVGEVKGSEVCIIGPEDSPLHTNQRVVCVVTDLASINNEDKANANLIAAAPELLEALQGCYARMVTHADTQKRWEHAKLYLEDIKSLIARATGKSS